jgi:septal ring factor EnvC (AmiA/AmiB activator)
MTLVAAAAALVAPATALAWSWPVEGPVLRAFSFGDDPYAGGQHRGIDIGAIPGAPVRAPAGGVVSFAGWVPTGGRTLTIQTPDGYSATLLHLGTLATRRGATVSEGDVVATVGPSGVPELAVPYVYFGIRRTSEPQGYLDPLLFLPPLAIAPPATAPRSPQKRPPPAEM